MRYKALVLDGDGTIISYDYHALPSDRVTRAVKAAQEKVSICFATGRSYASLKPILKKLDISQGHAIVDNGARVINLKNYKVLYEKTMDPGDVKEIIELCDKEKTPLYIKQDLYDEKYTDRHYRKGEYLKKSSMIFTDDIYPSNRIDDIMKKLSHLNNISIYKIAHKDGFGLNVQHAMATKLHGIEIVLKELNIDAKEAIGVGDGYNDFPLLMACGLKVAMGNAVDDLKVIADYIAPSVDRDGVADVIKKFILK
jgi:Cof subfamily protein (haloacid dehalogenase superfamily)